MKTTIVFRPYSKRGGGSLEESYPNGSARNAIEIWEEAREVKVPQKNGGGGGGGGEPGGNCEANRVTGEGKKMGGVGKGG